MLKHPRTQPHKFLHPRDGKSMFLLSSGLFQHWVQTRGTDHWPMPTHPPDPWGLFVAVHSDTASSGYNAKGEIVRNYDNAWSKSQLNQRQWDQHHKVQFSSVQSLSRVRLFVTPWTAAHQASLSITNSWSPPKPMSIESVMPSNHLILCHPLLLLPSIFPSIRVFSNESSLCIR